MGLKNSYRKGYFVVLVEFEREKNFIVHSYTTFPVSCSKEAMYI